MTKKVKKNKFKCIPTPNATARESDERRSTMIKNMKLKNLRKKIDVLVESLQNYSPPSKSSVLGELSSCNRNTIES
jgi:hypothetical protein